MKVCLHCGSNILDDGLRTCPQCGQLLPVAEPVAGRSQYVSGDLLKERASAQDLHPYLWGVEPSQHSAADAPRESGLLGLGGLRGGARSGSGGMPFIIALVLVLLAGMLGALYATGNGSWIPLLPH